MGILAVIWFIVFLFGFGSTFVLLSRMRLSEHPLLALLETAGLGLGLFSFLGVILEILHIPLDYRVYMVLAVVVPLFAAIRWMLKADLSGFSLRAAGTWCRKRLGNETTVIVLLLAVVLGVFLAIFLKGAFSYSYLEDDDPWHHVAGAVFVGTEKTYHFPQITEGIPYGWFYLEPYPPTYDVMMGVLWQFSPDAPWVLKFFNAVICMLAIAFAFLLARHYLDDRMAFVAAFILAVLPSFMSHFIWSQTLALAIFPLALLALLKSLDDKGWIPAAVMLIASMMVTQPVVSFIFGIVVLLLIVALFLHESFGSTPATRRAGKKAGKAMKAEAKKVKGVAGKGAPASFLGRFRLTLTAIGASAAGVFVGMLFWVQQLFRKGVSGIATSHGDIAQADLAGWAGPPGSYSSPIFTLRDVLFPAHSARIDQAWGFGIVMAALLVIGIVMYALAFRRSLVSFRRWLHWHLLIWFLLLLFWVFAPTLGLYWFGSHRFWAYLAIPAALFAARGLALLLGGLTKDRKTQAIIILIVCGLLAWSCLPAKIAVQTAQWPPGIHWTAQQELDGYAAMRAQLPPNTRVFIFCDSGARALGYGMMAESWSVEQEQFRGRWLNVTVDEALAFLQQHQYPYFTIDATCTKRADQETIQRFLDGLAASGRVQPVINQQGFLLGKVV